MMKLELLVLVVFYASAATAQADGEIPGPAPLSLANAVELLTPDYPLQEKGYVSTDDNLYYIASKLLPHTS